MKPRECQDRHCTEDAVMAIRTTHGSRNARGIKSVIYTDIADAPANAVAYCQPHGADVASGIVVAMTPPPVGVPT